MCIRKGVQFIMMEYQEFICTIEQNMKVRLQEEATVTLYTALKNNGTKRQGIMIKIPGAKVSPTIYLEEFYERLKCGICIEEVAESIFDLYSKIKTEVLWDISSLENYEMMREKVAFQLIQTKTNTELLQEVPNREFLDLSIVYYILLESAGNRQETAILLVKNEHIRQWNVCEEMLYKQAIENMAKMFKPCFFTMEQVIKGEGEHETEAGQNLLDMPAIPTTFVPAEEKGMFILTNPSGCFGAACIAYPGVLERIGRILKEDYYLLPSSVHEVVIVSCSYGMESDVMDEIVQSINQKHLTREEILSDHSYIFDVKNQKLIMKQ